MPTQLSAESSTAIPYDRVKRVGDVLVAGAALLVLSPVLLTTAIAVRATLGGEMLFRQRRPGRGGETFEMLKFRTMLEPDPSRGLVTDEERMTSFGNRLRATSLDELPGLLNVLRGDMSLVGPRPLLMQYLDRYTADQARRHEVLPGLTGLAQVSGRNSLSWDDRFALDVQYVETRGLRTDLSILLATIPKVFRREGISEDGRTTMSVFYGPRRIGNHEIRPGTGGERGDQWEVVERGGGAVVARCRLEPGLSLEDRGAVHVDPGVPEPETVRAQAVEMLRGVLRERGAEPVPAADGAVR